MFEMSSLTMTAETIGMPACSNASVMIFPERSVFSVRVVETVMTAVFIETVSRCSLDIREVYEFKDNRLFSCFESEKGSRGSR